MAETLTEPVPLKTDDHGIIHVGGTRVTLDTLIAAYREGASAEAIAEQYPPLPLGDIYSSLGYYLRHRAEIDAYLAKGEAESTLAREESKQRHGEWPDLRQRLLARQGR